LFLRAVILRGRPDRAPFPSGVWSAPERDIDVLRTDRDAVNMEGDEIAAAQPGWGRHPGWKLPGALPEPMPIIGGVFLRVQSAGVVLPVRGNDLLSTSGAATRVIVPGSALRFCSKACETW